MGRSRRLSDKNWPSRHSYRIFELFDCSDYSKNEVAKEYFRKRQEIIEGVSEKLESANRMLVEICVDYQSLVESLQAGIPADNETLAKYHEYIKGIGHKLHDMHALEGKLSIAGLNESRKLLTHYRLHIVKINNVLNLIKPTATRDEISLLAESLIEKRNALNHSLSIAFRNID
jgi:hypothetical protein